MHIRRSDISKLAPTVTESPQLQPGLCAVASEDLESKAGPKVGASKTVPLQNIYRKKY